LEGVDAVVSAAEEEQSPAILQVRSTLQALRDLA
jgi:fructose/tagatose bisphosphate aldolase